MEIQKKAIDAKMSENEVARDLLEKDANVLAEKHPPIIGWVAVVDKLKVEGYSDKRYELHAKYKDIVFEIINKENSSVPLPIFSSLSKGDQVKFSGQMGRIWFVGNTSINLPLTIRISSSSAAVMK